jgi:hypothetical protein
MISPNCWHASTTCIRASSATSDAAAIDGPESRPMGKVVGRFRDVLIPGCLVAVTVWLWIVAGQFQGGVGRYEVLGPAFFPKVLLGALGLVALLQIGREIAFGGSRAEAEPPTIQWRDLASAIGITLAYAAILGHAGFLLSTVLFQMALLTVVFGYRRPAIVVGVPLGLTALYGAIFLGLMNVPLPRGRWLFADFSRLFY